MINKTFNQLLILLDRTKLFDKKDGFIVTKRDFDLLDTKVDLGFVHLAESFQNDSFYSIPILFYGSKKSELAICRNIGEISSLTGRDRFLANLSDSEKPLFYEIDGNNVRSLEYWLGDFDKLSKRDENLGQKIADVERDFRHYAA